MTIVHPLACSVEGCPETADLLRLEGQQGKKKYVMYLCKNCYMEHGPRMRILYRAAPVVPRGKPRAVP